MKKLVVSIQLPNGVEPSSLLDQLRAGLSSEYGPECKVIDDNVDTTALEDQTQADINDRATAKDEAELKHRRYKERLDARVAEIPDSDLPLHIQYAGAEKKKEYKSQIAVIELAKEGIV